MSDVWATVIVWCIGVIVGGGIVLAGVALRGWGVRR